MKVVSFRLDQTTQKKLGDLTRLFQSKSFGKVHISDVIRESINHMHNDYLGYKDKGDIYNEKTNE